MKKRVPFNSNGKRVIRICDFFHEECLEIGCYLYCLTSDEVLRKKAIIALDNLEIIMQKDVNDIENLEKFKIIVKKMSEDLNTNVIYHEESFKRIKK